MRTLKGWNNDLPPEKSTMYLASSEMKTAEVSIPVTELK
jgi:hypothetical protein